MNARKSGVLTTEYHAARPLKGRKPRGWKEEYWVKELLREAERRGVTWPSKVAWRDFYDVGVSATAAIDALFPVEK